MAKQNTKRLLEKIKASIEELLNNPPVNAEGDEVPIGPKDLASLATTIIQIHKLETDEERRAQEANAASGDKLGMQFPPMPVVKP